MPSGSFARAASLAVALAFTLSSCAPDGETDGQRGERPVVVIQTSKGTITAELFDEQSPKSVENFLAYVDAGFYDGTTFHRVIPGFMIQGGGYDVGGSLKATKAPIQNEADNGLKNERGTLAMARTADVNSATSQFFINLVDNAFLDHGQRDFGYAVFGRVTEGMDVVDAIAESGDASGIVSDAVTIEKIERKS